MGSLEQLAILVVIVCAAVALFRFVPIPAPFGQIVQIIVWAIVAVFAIKVIFSLLAGGGLGHLASTLPPHNILG
jgi:hypothetical protein